MPQDTWIALAMIAVFAVVMYLWLRHKAREFDRKYGE